MAVEPLELAACRIAGGSDGPEPISLPSRTVAAFLGRTERGPVDEPVAIRSFDEYRRAFGGHSSFGFLSHAVQHYFLNGGESAIVVRLTNRATRATIELPAGEQALRLAARQPGSREYLRVSVDYDGVEHDPSRFNLVVQRLSRPRSQLIEDQELFPGVSIESSDRRFVVDALQASALVRLSGPLPTRRPTATTANHPGQPIPYVDMTSVGMDGDELTDYDVVGSNEEGLGLFALDRVDRFDLLCIPPPPARDFGTTAFLAAQRYCSRRRAMLIWDPPWAWRSSGSAVRGLRSAAITSHDALSYFPRLRPRAELTRFPAGIPACGAVAGLLARADRERGIAAVPASTQLKASLTTVTDVDEQQASALCRYGVNTLTRVQGGGVVMDGNACFVPQDREPSEFQRLDTRRAALAVLGALERGTHWACGAVSEPGSAELLERQAQTFFAGLHRRGVFAGLRAEQAFFARVRRPLDDAAALTLRAGFALRTPAHFQVYEIEYLRDRMSTREVPPLSWYRT